MSVLLRALQKPVNLGATMAPSVETSPAVVQANNSTFTVPSFAYAANRRIVVFVAANAANNASNDVVSVSGGGLTWTLVTRSSRSASGGSGVADGTCEVWTAYNTNAQSFAITGTLTSVNHHVISTFVVADDVAGTWSGVSARFSVLSGLPSLELIPRPGTLLLVGSLDWNAAAGAAVLGPDQSNLVTTAIPGQVTAYTWRRNTAFSGQQTLNLTAPAAQAVNMVALELSRGVLAAPGTGFWGVRL